jgi:hypothetical protein
MDANAGPVQGTRHVTSDPTPPDFELATPEEVLAYKIAVDSYAEEWMGSYAGLSEVSAELIWADYTNDFCEEALKNLGETRLKAMRDTLLHHGVGVKTKRGFPRRLALIECLQAERCPEPQQDARYDTAGGGSGTSGREVAVTDYHEGEEPVSAPAERVSP